MRYNWMECLFDWREVKSMVRFDTELKSSAIIRLSCN
jgi:hypothetical protein